MWLGAAANMLIQFDVSILLDVLIQFDMLVHFNMLVQLKRVARCGWAQRPTC